MATEPQQILPYEAPALEDHPAGDHGRSVPLVVRALLMLLVIYLPHLWLFATDLFDTGRGRGLARVSWYLPGFVLYWLAPRAQRPHIHMPMLMATGMFYFLMLIPRRPRAVLGMIAFGTAIALLNSWLIYLWLTRRIA
jgi:hypothetical protein